MKRGLHTWMSLLLLGAISCQKKDYDNGFTAFAPVFFVNKSVLGNDLQVKYNGTPISWDASSGKIEVPEGTGKFEFFDRRNGKVLAEKTVEVIKTQKDSLLIFQPTAAAPIAFLDARGQVNEPPPTAGFIKIKMANYAPSLLPFEQLDVIVVGINANFEFINLDTLETVRKNLGTENYHLIPTPSDILAYTFYFKQHGTDTKVKNAMGDDYVNMDIILFPDMIDPRPVKNIYTIYFAAVEPAVGTDLQIKVGDKYYNIDPVILYAD